MALTVSTDLVSITAAENADDANWSDIGGGSGSAQEPDFAVQGTECRSRAVSGASASRGMIYDNGADLDFTTTHADKLIYFWIATFAPGLVDNLATAPGLRIIIDTSVTPGTNYWEWDIMYSDLLASEGSEFFRVYVLDPRAPATRSGGSPSLTTLRHFGVQLDTNAGAKGQNLAIDRISYGFGELIASGTADDEASGFQEMVDWDWGAKTNRYGIISERGGVSYVKGKLVIGDDAGTAATVFTGQNNVFVWEPTWYYDGTRVRPTVGYDSSGNWTGRKSDGTPYYGIEFRGNGTGDTDITFGAAVGADSGRSGPSFTGSLQIPTELTADDAAVEDVAFYGTTFRDFRKLDLSGNAATDIVKSCNFIGCGSLDVGLVIGRNNNVINGVGGGYKFLEYFYNLEAAAAEQLSTADPITEWTDVLNGADWSVPSEGAGYVELLGGTTRTNITTLDDDKMGSDDHYAECVIRFPAAGAGQGTLGPTIAGHATNEDYFWVEADLVNDTIELWRTSTGVDTSLDGPDAFTMDEDEDYLVLIRRNGTTIEAFVSGNSVADGYHTGKLTATDANHTGTAQRLVGLRGDALTGQTGATGERPQVKLFGAGPITDNLGSLIFPAAASLDYQDGQFINCTRAFGFDTAGTYSINNLILSGNLVGAQNDSGGLVTGNITDGTVPSNEENLGSSTSSFTASVGLEVNGASEGSRLAMIGDGGIEDGVTLLEGYANSAGKVTGSFSGTTPQNVIVRGRNSGIINAAILEDPVSSFIDYTDEAREQVGANDVVLTPAVPAVNDAFYFGGLAQFGRVMINVSTAGVTYVGTWEYYNGSWVSLTATDDTNSFQTSGWNEIFFTKPGDWAVTTINSQGPFYYIRFRVTTGGGTGASGENITLKGTTRYEPFLGSGLTVASVTGLTSTVVWIADNIAE